MTCLTWRVAGALRAEAFGWGRVLRDQKPNTRSGFAAIFCPVIGTSCSTITRPVRDDDRAAFESMTHKTKYTDLAPEFQRYRRDIFDDKYRSSTRTTCRQNDHPYRERWLLVSIPPASDSDGPLLLASRPSQTISVSLVHLPLRSSRLVMLCLRCVAQTIGSAVLISLAGGRAGRNFDPRYGRGPWLVGAIRTTSHQCPPLQDRQPKEVPARRTAARPRCSDRDQRRLACDRFPGMIWPSAWFSRCS